MKSVLKAIGRIMCQAVSLCCSAMGVVCRVVGALADKGAEKLKEEPSS